ncbi:unnamed protein product [Schistosoma mattheei]|uniref:Cytosolic endo-beta-N-acetylglucosaminidase TIM barrel domain-containing protein n=1 Tax=Schistosoma mattheei TaxID=31246 RepID=A0A183NQ45_9TREM|nr:unnamed protein product [Schistosoma mattheei]
MCDESSYISKPISTIQELIHWDFPSTSNLTIPLSYFSDFLNGNLSFPLPSSGLPKVIYCHDMAGGYLSSDRTVNFTCVFPAFRFVHWHLVDIFIYFSHQFITIPPVSWINLAHSYLIIFMFGFGLFNCFLCIFRIIYQKPRYYTIFENMRKVLLTFYNICTFRQNVPKIHRNLVTLLTNNNLCENDPLSRG